METWIDDIFKNEKRKKLKEMCRTRWIERHEAFETFADLFVPIVCCLEGISRGSASEWNRDTRSDAQSHLLALSQFTFIVALMTTESIFSYTKGLTVRDHM